MGGILSGENREVAPQPEAPRADAADDSDTTDDESEDEADDAGGSMILPGLVGRAPVGAVRAHLDAIALGRLALTCRDSHRAVAADHAYWFRASLEVANGHWGWLFADPVGEDSDDRDDGGDDGNGSDDGADDGADRAPLLDRWAARFPDASRAPTTWMATCFALCEIRLERLAGGPLRGTLPPALEWAGGELLDDGGAGRREEWLAFDDAAPAAAAARSRRALAPFLFSFQAYCEGGRDSQTDVYPMGFRAYRRRVVASRAPEGGGGGDDDDDESLRALRQLSEAVSPREPGLVDSFPSDTSLEDLTWRWTRCGARAGQTDRKRARV